MPRAWAWAIGERCRCRTVGLPGKKGYGKAARGPCQFAREVEYRAEDYPRTIEFIDSHSYLSGVYPPNTMELMGATCAASAR